MSIKVYCVDGVLVTSKREKVSEAIHQSMMQVLGLPQGKRAHRFVRVNKDDFYIPEGRTEEYIVIEINLMVGRTKETKHNLIKSLFDNLDAIARIKPNDVEVVIVESPPENWGFRGMTGSEAMSKLPYKIET